MKETLFLKIVRREIPAKIVYQDALVTAFRDINPLAPVHVLIVPNRLIPSMAQAEEADEATLGRMMRVAAEIAEAEGISQSGYRLIVNCGRDGGQEVPHLHLHLVGGRRLGAMLSRKERSGR